MTIGEPIEEQAVRMWMAVYGNIEMSMEDAREAFWMQEPSIIAGWKRLATQTNERVARLRAAALQVTSEATLERLQTIKHAEQQHIR